jgi:hypothetical protein
VKVWESADPNLSADLEELSPEAPPEELSPGASVEGIIDMLPTRPVPATPVPSLSSIEPEPSEPLLKADVIEDQPTRPLTGTPSNPHHPPVTTATVHEVEQIDTVSLPAKPLAKPALLASPAISIVRENTMAPTPLHMKLKPTRARLPFIAAAILLPILVLGGLGVWAVVFHPFSVAPVTEPWQSFSDSGLGISLHYPNGWQSQIDRAKSTIYFSDSSHTGQVYITVTNASTNDLTQVLQQQATQAAIAGGKVGTPLSFAGASWQQIQGTVQQKGANYTEVIFVTIHGNHLFKIAQLAPLSTYPSEENLCFAPMRASFHFL